MQPDSRMRQHLVYDTSPFTKLVDDSADWWTQFQVESVEKSDEEKARASMKRALVLGYTAEQIADMASEIEVEIAASK